MSNDIRWLIESKRRPSIAPVHPGDRVKVSVKTKEGEKERTQVFHGVVIRVRKGGNNASFTVRQVAYGIGVERTFFQNSPYVEKVEVTQHGDVRRARLFYLRGLSSKATRAKLKAKAKAIAPELVVEEGTAEEEAILEEPQPAESAGPQEGGRE
ncbi:MAG: 50S ribosomal protein L19 [Chloroflexi bacterium RBG_13_60_13]|nr:MAG: 50S ribosomal protein L19 [Chloroflexi bacterium RBG_13_60_13]